MRRDIEKRLQTLEAKGTRVRLCKCAAQLEAIKEARAAIDLSDGKCLYCGRPVTARWPQFVEGLQKAYGGVEHGTTN